MGAAHRVALRLQSALNELGYGLLIFDDEDVHLGSNARWASSSLSGA
jgi:hypothetical protein